MTADEPLTPRAAPWTQVRFQVLAAFAMLAGLTYFDRICISQAARPMGRDLGLDEFAKGLVFSAFTLAYALFEVPTGWLGDAIGPRKVLVRVVLWWSAFTALTGRVIGLRSLLFVRFAFGAGEAGAFPNIARALTRWFPSSQRGRVQAVIWTASRLGGAVAPPITAFLIASIGWRHAFLVFGCAGVLWAVPFWLWYRDDPAEHPRVSPEEREYLQSSQAGELSGVPTSLPTPWARIAANRSVWGLSLAAFWSAFGWYFFITWLPTYLEEGRSLPATTASWLAGLPLLFGIFGCTIGGWLSDALALRVGTRWARRAVGCVAMMAAGLCFQLAVVSYASAQTIVFLALASFCNDLPMSSLWAANMDVGERFAGSVSGVVSAASAAGALISPLLFGALLNSGHGWTPALIVAGLGFPLSGLCWLLVDPTRTVVPTKSAGPEIDQMR
jgi:sugar phosphate permease